MEHLFNKNVREINAMRNDLIEAIHNFLSRVLMDTSEDKPLKCDICLEMRGTYGLSSNCMPYVTKMWQDPEEGWIQFEIDESYVRDFGDMDIEELMNIVNDFN